MSFLDAIVRFKKLFTCALPQSVADSRNSRFGWFLMGTLALAKLWLVSGQPLLALADNSHDDLLFVRLANYLVQFQWLGPYDNLTLAKGPFYPLWIALSFLAGAPLLLSQHLLYIAACLVTERALQPLIGSRLWRMAIFVLLLFNPVTFTWQLTRVLRDGLYVGLTLLIVGSAIGLLARRHEPAQNLAGWAITCGLATAAFWLTREEGVWILPFLVPLLIWTLAAVVFSDRRNWRKMAVIALTPVLPILAIQVVSMMNWNHYGIYASVEFKTPEFKAAYGALTRVRHKEYKLQVPVPKETLQRIYKESPRFAELQPFLEREGFWNVQDMVFENHPSGSTEILGGWLMWALRDAAAGAGYFSSGTQSAQYFQRLAAEVNTACAEKRLDCLDERVTLMPPWRNDYLIPVLDRIGLGFRMLAKPMLPVDLIPSQGHPDSLSLFQDLTLERLSGQGTIVRGWAVHASEVLTVKLVEVNTGRVVATARRDPSPDIHQYFAKINQEVKETNHARFTIKGLCIRPCILKVSNGSGAIADVPLKKGSTSWFTDPLWIHIDDTSSQIVLERQAEFYELKRSLLKSISLIYQITVPYLIIVSLPAIGIWLYWSVKDRRVYILGFIALSLFAALCARLLILAIVDVTSFPAIIIEYLGPLYPIALICSGLFITDAINLNKESDH